jgi:hypothetical protein
MPGIVPGEQGVIMADKPTKATKPKSNPSPEPKASGTPKRRRFWSAKRISMWLAGPTALLVFLNEAATVKQLFTSSSPSKNEVKLVVEHHDPNAEPATDPKTPPLSIEAARFDEEDPNKLDIVCRNASYRSAFVKTADVEILHVWQLQPVVASRGPLASTANYDLALPAPSGPSKFQKSLIQEVAPKTLDRFSITVGAAPSNEISAKVYLFRLNLLCGSQSFPAGEFLYMTTPARGSPQPSLAANKTAVAEMLKSTGNKNALLAKFLAAEPAN